VIKRALITGITGQDGSYLAELLLAKGYEVHGLVRRTSSENTSRIGHLLGRAHLHRGDMTDTSSILAAVRAVQPAEVYNLAAQSDVRQSFDEPEHTADVTGVGTARLLEATRIVCGPDVGFYQASSSELFGGLRSEPLSERTPFHPRSPYAAAKSYAFDATRLYREAYGLRAVNGILFNHESPRRGEQFVSRKITRAVGRIVAGTQERLRLGNLKSMRDWGFAGDYVEAMWRMLQLDVPDDYVIATGEAYSVREFVDLAFARVGLDSARFVDFDDSMLRPAEVNYLQGDASKAAHDFGWRPTVSFQDLVAMMVDHDVDLARREAST
jgi:GDPmannose 4,6-dehydratase